MYAIVDIAGQQFKVEKDKKIYVNRLEGAEGSKVEFDKILLFDNEDNIKVGTPQVQNMIVSATIISHLKGDKVLVFKKKRRKGYQKMNGHRQFLTELHIDDIKEGKISKAKKEEIAEKAPVKAKVTEVTKKEEKVTVKSVEPKEVAAKKPEAKKVQETKTEKKPPAKKTGEKAQTVKKPAPSVKKAAGSKSTTAKKTKPATKAKTGGKETKARSAKKPK